MCDEKRMERVEEKVDALSEHLADIKLTLGLNTQSLQEHMRRTALLEDEVRVLHDGRMKLSGAQKLGALFLGLPGLALTVLEIIKAAHGG